MFLRTAIGLFCGLSTLMSYDSVVKAEMQQPPIRFKINKDFLEKIVHIRDQEFLNLFKDTYVEKAPADMDSVKFSLTT